MQMSLCLKRRKRGMRLAFTSNTDHLQKPSSEKGDSKGKDARYQLRLVFAPLKFTIRPRTFDRSSELGRSAVSKDIHPIIE